MWEAIGGLLTLAVMIFRLWLSNEAAKESKFNANKKAISDAVASGNHAAINAIIMGMRR